MNLFTKILFWFFVIILGFINPLISFGLLVLYYLPGIISDLCNSCKSVETTKITETETTEFRYTVSKNPKMDSYSSDTLEEMK